MFLFVAEEQTVVETQFLLSNGADVFAVKIREIKKAITDTPHHRDLVKSIST